MTIMQAAGGMRLAVALALAALVPPVAGALAGGPWEVSVDVARDLGEVRPFVFGHNIEAADPKDIFGPRSNPIPGRTGDGVWDPDARRPALIPARALRKIGARMMRYPGGCLAHNFDWKRAVGPLAERPDYAFGLDEFLEYCRALGLEPLMTTSAYVGGPRDMADLVEYLNAPADTAHPWARKRAAWGHTEPWGVRYFEMGNESDHGNHDVKPSRKHTAKSYSEWFVESSRLMRAVDPRIRMGALMGTGTPPADPWNSQVLELTRGKADFIIVHTYAVGVWRSTSHEPQRVLRAAMAAGDQIEAMLGEYRALVRARAGRDVPLAITEYNASYVQDKPFPMRFSYAGALFSADYIRVLLKPEANVLMANYWHFLNGYWGMLRGPRVPGEGGNWRRMPAYHLFGLWGRHFGERLVAARARGPKLEFEGCHNVRPALAESGAREVDFSLRPGSGGRHAWRVRGARSMALDADGHTGNAYPEFARASVPEGRTVRLSFESRATGDLGAGTRFGIGMIDARGWDATKSGTAVDGLPAGEEWTRHSTSLVTLPGCEGVSLTWRVLGGERPVSARVEVRDLRLEIEREFPPYETLTASASLSRDGRTLYLVVFNKHHESDTTARVRVAGAALTGGRLWRVTGPSLAATNLERETVRETVSARRVEGVSAGGFEHAFPRLSMTAFELDLEGPR